MSTDEDGFSLDAFKGLPIPKCLKINDLNKKGWKNKIGTSDRKCPVCGSWKEHWIKLSRQEFDGLTCSKEGCSNKAEDGAHIIRQPNYQEEWIAPLCAKCNNPNNTEPFNLRVETILVRAVECK